jgi:predicted lipid-binding transport protein (Tim44 family)
MPDWMAIPLTLLFLAAIFYFFVAWLLVKYRGWSFRLGILRKRREHQVEVLAEEAATDDPAFAPEAVKASAAQLHADIMKAWNDADPKALATLLGKDLLTEWKLRLADFEHKGWHNVSEVLAPPEIEYIGLVNRADDAEDRVVIHIRVPLRDVVYNRQNQVITRNEDANHDGRITQSEYWTLARRGEGWMLVSIEQELEGAHQLKEPIVPSPWADDRVHDEAVTERAVAAAVPDEQVREVGDVDFDGDARVAALDMANVDGRFAPDVLEAAARRALAGWTEAVDGDDAALEAVAAPGVAAEMLYPGDPGHRSRLVVRGLKLKALRITALDAKADPPTMTVEATISGARYVENRDTTTVLSGSKDRQVVFTERWRMALDGRDDTPWRIAGFEPAVDHHRPSATR